MPKRQSPEKTLVLNKVLRKLKTFMLTGDVLWYQRLSAGRMGGYMLAPAGTPDVVAVVNQGNGGIAILFIECKRPGKTKLDYEQTPFFESMLGKPKILCRVINDVKQLWPYIKEAKNL